MSLFLTNYHIELPTIICVILLAMFIPNGKQTNYDYLYFKNIKQLLDEIERVLCYLPKAEADNIDLGLDN